MPQQITIAIDQSIFDLAPGYRRAILVARGIDNTQPNQTVAALLSQEIERVKQQVTEDDSRLVAWREAFLRAEINPKKFRPSIDALTRRILGGGTIPSISPLVDIGTILSLRHLVPCGAHSLDDVITELVLRRATGTEQFIAFGSDEVEICQPGQVIFSDNQTVATSRWVWRQANHTIIAPETRSLELNIDALSIIDDGTLDHIVENAAALIGQSFSVEPTVYIVDEAHPSISV